MARVRRARLILLIAALAAPLLVTSGGPAAGGGPCESGHVEARGLVSDAATGLPLGEVTSVEHEPIGPGTPADGGSTNANSRFSVCLLPGEYQFTFRADSYRVDQAAGVQVTLELPGPMVITPELTPRGRVIAGRVTNMNGASRFASIGIFRQAPNGRWVGIDGEGNQMPSGWWSYRVPSYGRYKVNACVDNHWCQWAPSANRRSLSRTIVVGPSTTFINNVHIRVPFCRSSPPDFCIPWGFNR